MALPPRKLPPRPPPWWRWSAAAGGIDAKTSAAVPTSRVATREPRMVMMPSSRSRILRRQQHLVDDVDDAVGVDHVVDADVGEAAGGIAQQQVHGTVEPRRQLGAR